MIILREISLSFGHQQIFNKISATFQADQKTGIVGRNGTGKSTLLRVISGSQKPDDGSVSITKDLSIAYMPQEVILHSSRSVYDEAMSVFEKYLKMQARKDTLEKKLETHPKDAEKLTDEYLELLEKLAHFDYATAKNKAHEILSGLGFSDEQKQQEVDTLSVGWKMRVVLAKLLLQDADYYLFDEPTNHLDINTKEWFFEFLKSASFGFLLVSHDRYYLDHLCDHIFELERGNGTMYTGAFSKYVELKEQQREVTQAAFDRQQKEITRKQKTIERFRASATKAKMVQSMIKQLDKMELVEVEPPLPTIHLTFPQAQRSGKVVLRVTNVSHAFDNKPLFAPSSFEIMRGQKVALVAPNGTGKTTLFNLITGKLALQEGAVEFGHNVDVAFFEQDQTRVLKPENSIWDEVAQATRNIPESTIRGFLGSFLFSGDDIHKKTKVLSGGERNRVAMVKVLLQKANFLILDEPTNHLDLYAKEILLQALKQFDGTILMVSHDHDFIQKVADTVLELTPKGVFTFPGKYEDFLKERNVLAQKTPSQLEQTHKINSQSSEKKLTNEQRKQIKKLEQQISKLEHNKEKISNSFADLTYGSPAFEQAQKKLKAIEKELENVMVEWEKLQMLPFATKDK